MKHYLQEHRRERIFTSQTTTGTRYGKNMEDKNKERFYENYESIRNFVINGKDLTKKEEVLALCDLLVNTKHLEISKATRKKNEYIKLLSEEKGVDWKVRKEAIKTVKGSLQTFVHILILAHLEDGEYLD